MHSQPISQNTMIELSDNVDLYVDIVTDRWGDSDEIKRLVSGCIAATLGQFPDGGSPVELSVRMTDDDEIQQLNQNFRAQDKATNVLSFPGFAADELEEAYRLAGASGPPVMLGDIVIAHGVTAREAQEQAKNISDHLAHLIVHGLLHLLGFDHIEDQEAEKMEAFEKKILASLGIDNPYREEGCHVG